MGRGFPMTYFLPISVGTFTKGLGFDDLAQHLGALAVFIPVLTAAQPAAAAEAGALSRRMRDARQHLLARHQGAAQLPAAISCCSGWSSTRSRSPIIAQAQSNSQEVHNASIAIVDEDHSGAVAADRACVSAALFPAPQTDRRARHRPLMNAGRYTFVIDIPPNFERDVLAGASPRFQLNVDATAMVQAGLGSGYATADHHDRDRQFPLPHGEPSPLPPVELVVRIAFNPNVTTAWFTSVMGIINSITMLAIILAGAAVVREREHGTMDHLLVMPLTPFEIAMSKIWANALVITVAVGLSLYLVVRTLLGIPIAGSIPLFLCRRRDLPVLSPPPSASSSARSRARCRSSACSTCWFLPMNMLSGSNTARKHAALAGDDHAGVAVDAFRVVRAGDPLSRRRDRRGLAAIPGGRRHRRPVFDTVAGSIPLRAEFGLVLAKFLPIQCGGLPRLLRRGALIKAGPQRVRPCLGSRRKAGSLRPS